MTTQVKGFTTANVADVDGLVFRAQKGTTRPAESGLVGAYCLGTATGILPAALAANSEVFQFRNAGPSGLMIVQKVVVSVAVSTTLFAAGVPLQIDMVRATGWSVAGTGGTQIALALNSNCKERSSLTASSLDGRIATTAALGAGTKTLEGNSLAALAAPGPITTSNVGTIIKPGTVLFQPNTQDGLCPLILDGASQEGFVIRSVAVPATGTWTLAIQVYWTEASSY